MSHLALLAGGTLARTLQGIAALVAVALVIVIAWTINEQRSMRRARLDDPGASTADPRSRHAAIPATVPMLAGPDAELTSFARAARAQREAGQGSLPRRRP